MSGLEFNIRYPSGGADRLVVDSDRVLIGSGAHCEIRLPADQAAVEHVLVTAFSEGVHLKAQALDPQPTINGSAFVQTPFPAGSILGVGQVEIQIGVVEIDDDTD